MKSDRTLYKDTLENFLGIPTLSGSQFPLDYGILFTGLEYRFGEIEYTRKQSIKGELVLTTFISDTIQALSIEEERKKILLEALGFDQNDAIYTHIDSMNLRILEAFSILLKNVNNRDSDDWCIEVFQQIGLSSFSYQKENTFFFDLVHYFHRFQQFHDEKIALLPFNTGKM